MGNLIVDFEGSGKQRERSFVEPDVYIASIVGVSDIYVSTNPFNNEEEGKMTITFEVMPDLSVAKFVQLPYFIRAKIVHSGKKQGYSDSKLYTLLLKAGLLEECKTFFDGIKDDADNEKKVVDWLKEKLMGKSVKVMAKTIQPKDGGSVYSTVSEVIKFVDIPLNPANTETIVEESVE
ncbi:MAG: hypothetical protein Q8O68_00510 [Candidatus Daviesbacteria bacterium]|nr:hypothetical protein [Candidatus Daviesbacteria bacterium]